MSKAEVNDQCKKENIFLSIICTSFAPFSYCLHKCPPYQDKGLLCGLGLFLIKVTATTSSPELHAVSLCLCVAIHSSTVCNFIGTLRKSSEVKAQ